jgi:hypothetical protein
MSDSENRSWEFEIPLRPLAREFIEIFRLHFWKTKLLLTLVSQKKSCYIVEAQYSSILLPKKLSQMKRFASTLFLIVWIVMPARAADKALLDVLVFDGITGKAVAVTAFELFSAERNTAIKVSTFTSPGRATLILERGEWNITVVAESYHRLASHVRLGELRAVRFYLDPIQHPAALAVERIHSLRRNDATLMTGYVVDDETGTAVAGALIQTNYGDVYTDADGFFQTYTLASQPANAPVEARTMIIAKAAYQTESRVNIEVWENGDWHYTIRLRRGTGTNLIEEGRASRGARTEECPSCMSATENTVSSVIMPSSIRVGRNCTGTSCTTVEVHPLESYVKRVLPAEWYSCWGSLANGMHSLQAGAVAIRSYGLWYVYHPLSSTYDICDNTSCQAFGSATSTNANNAVDATTRYILTDAAQANVQRSEYSAENNNSGCGDGFTGTGTSWPCISDQTCLGQTRNGHGRGMCQWGSARWANGTRILTSSPCAQGISHGLGTKTWQEILAHYYPSYTLTRGESATIQSVVANPTTVAQGSTFSIQYTLEATAPFAVILGASIAPAGTTTYASDPARDLKVTLAQGGNTVARSFVVPSTQQTGAHDLVAAVWHDKNNNNIIDAGDFVINSASYTGALTITLLPVQLVSFTATRININDVRLNWRTLSEINNFGFYVQRRAEGEQRFADRPNSFVAGHGTTNEPHDYSFVDSTLPAGRWHYRLRQLDLDGTPHFTEPIEIEIPTSVAEGEPTEFELFQNYPNPFNPATIIRFTIPVGAGHAPSLLKVFDVLGREVATLVNETREPGEYSVLWKPENLAGGVYVYALQSGGKQKMKRLVFLK